MAVCLAAIANGSDSILILRPSGIHFDEAANGLVHELGLEFETHARLLAAGDDAAAVANEIHLAHCKAVVLMDNQAIQLYAQVQKLWRDSLPPPPGVALMAVRVDRAIAGMARMTGIFYEVPAVTTVMNLRSILSSPVRKVGVLARPSMRDFVKENAKWCQSENIQLLAFEIPEAGQDPSLAVRRGLRRLRLDQDVDALWILNDNFLLTPEIIAGGWLPALEHFRKPVVVGVENLVTSAVSFGTFALLPDHYALGVQTAGIILRLKAADWEAPDSTRLEQPLAVYKILNLPQARKVASIRDEALVEIDKVLR